MKKLPIGTEDFKKVIEGDFYYIDKTSAISLIEENNVDVMLFTRPRRFGKTLFISMLDYFYNIENSSENKKLFNGLDISRTKYISNQGKYPTISISLKDLRASDFNGMLIMLKNKLRPLITKISEFSDLDDELKKSIEDIKNIEVNTTSLALQIFTEAYYKHYGKKVILLIDEYEAPILNAYQNGYINEALQFFSSLYSSALKTNPYLEKAVITGITRISQANIFSGLNNINIYSTDTLDFSNTFGFTQDEVENALKEYNLSSYKEGVKDYYDGYLFGKTEIYNPWSILNFLKNKELKPYWTKTASTKIISSMLIKASNQIKQTFIELSKNKEVKLRNANPNELLISDLADSNKLFAYMITTGYITYTKDGSFKIVNKEVLQSISDISASGLYKVPSDLIGLRDSLNDGNLEGVELFLKSIFDDTFSYMDLSKKTTEETYHVAFASLLYSLGIGEFKSNKEAGSGRYDIAFKNYDINKYSYIFEFKKATSISEMGKKLDEGINQIKDKNYIEEIKEYNKKMIVCLCFYKKEIKIKYEIIK